MDGEPRLPLLYLCRILRSVFHEKSSGDFAFGSVYHGAGTALPCGRNGEVAVSFVDVPAELQKRSVLVTLGSGPNDTDAVLVTLNGLNQYGQTATLPEGTYYCNAAVQYDALNDWPLREV